MDQREVPGRKYFRIEFEEKSTEKRRPVRIPSLVWIRRGAARRRGEGPESQRLMKLWAFAVGDCIR